MKYLKCPADDLGAYRFGGIGKKALLWAMVSGLLTGPAVAASFSYEKNVVKLLQKNPALALEIVEALKDCRLVKGMTEEQATLVGRRWTRLTPRASNLGVLDTGIDKVTTKDEQGRKSVKVLFYTQIKANTGPSADGAFQWQKQAGPRVIDLALYFTNGELTAWSALYSGMSDADRAKIRQDIEDRLAKSGIRT